MPLYVNDVPTPFSYWNGIYDPNTPARHIGAGAGPGSGLGAGAADGSGTFPLPIALVSVPFALRFLLDSACFKVVFGDRFWAGAFCCNDTAGTNAVLCFFNDDSPDMKDRQTDACFARAQVLLYPHQMHGIASPSRYGTHTAAVSTMLIRAGHRR